MTQLVEKTGARSDTDPLPVGPRRSRAAQARSMVPLVALVLAFLLFLLPPYLGLDPSQGRIPNVTVIPARYPLLIVHIATATIALLTLCLQMWPWLRERHPKAHRISGRVYVFAGALPAAVLSVVLSFMATSSHGVLGVITAGVFWGVTTAVGFLRARQGRWSAHRRWMLYSFAFALQAVWARLLAIGSIVLGLSPDPILMGEAGTWLGWIVNVLLVQWWLVRTARRARQPVASY
ncbi:DUF2306 domain-containing protein [Amycolatopsis sp. OK19-0408]|uniref:DUF2306 domain-containing protein n=1 Tax=Amycolatopsis iheyensis TaxID=2945988 RepID=A0A9X2NA93_9PSEU|nr:DUF2306 domain-containing protein [Amycolatopsis iheyensis]MCR6483497.1 DUF2306 domain-containing protein [Amycolatopsis iheyensis]